METTTEVPARTMNEHGFDVTHMLLTGSSHMRLGHEGPANLVDAIIAIGD